MDDAIHGSINTNHSIDLNPTKTTNEPQLFNNIPHLPDSPKPLKHKADTKRNAFVQNILKPIGKGLGHIVLGSLALIVKAITIPLSTIYGLRITQIKDKRVAMPKKIHDFFMSPVAKMSQAIGIDNKGLTDFDPVTAGLSGLGLRIGTVAAWSAVAVCVIAVVLVIL